MTDELLIPVHSPRRRLVPPGSPVPMFGHPDDGAIWALIPRHGVVRLHGDSHERIANADAVGIPNAGRVLLYSHQVQFYFDTARRAPVWLVSTYGTEPPSVLLGVWKGQRFESVEQHGGAVVLGGDGFAFDPSRGVLVHFLGASDTSLERQRTREKNGGVVVRELGVDGIWRDIPGVLPGLGQSRLFAGWDGRRGKIAVIDEESRRTLAWDGATWEELPPFPHLAWAPWAMALAPHTRELVYVHAERSTDHRVLAWVLRDDRWEQQEAEGFSQFGGAAYDPVADACLVASPWFGPGTIPTQWGRLEGGRVMPAGEPLFPALGATSSGPPLLWGKAPAAAWQHPKAGSRAVVAALADDGLRPLPAVPAPALAVVRRGDAPCSVGPTGDVFTLDLSGGTWHQRVTGSLPPRTRSSVGCDPATGRVLLVGGDPPREAAFHKDVWLLGGDAWSEVTAKGTRPALVEARVAYHAGLGAWMVVGGHDNKGRRSDKVWLCDGKKWTSFAATWDGAAGEDAPHIVQLAWDPASRQMLLVAGDALWVYAGEGAWRSLGRFAERPATVAYDDHARRIVSYHEAQDWRADVGALLDRVAAAAAPPAESAARKPAAKPRAKEEEDALPSAVWLRCQDGESDKFWFAALAGSEWTARWGRRGKPAQEKRSGLDTPQKARADYEKQVRAKLKAGYEHAPEQEAAAVIPGRTAWFFKLGAKGADLFGGVPPGFDATNWPCCADCRHPMQFIALFHADAERLPLAEGAGLAVFACNGHFSAGACETWEADAGCNAAVVVSAEQLARTELKKPPPGPGGEEPIPPLRRRKIGYQARFEVDAGAEENAERPDEASKLGGYPSWLQGDDPPECAACGGAMDFVAQIDEREDADLNFGGGIGYLFRCPHAAKFQWQR